MKPEQMRQLMPMTRYWRIQQTVKNSVAIAFYPLTFMLGLAVDRLKIAADHLQEKLIHRKDN